MNGKQEAALGPRYTDFKSVYGHTSGVALGVALAYGIDVDAFSRINEPCVTEGELVLKVWTVKSSRKILWCYVASDNGANICFPLFQPTNSEGGLRAHMIIAAPLGTHLHMKFSLNSRGNIRCDSVVECLRPALAMAVLRYADELCADHR